MFYLIIHFLLQPLYWLLIPFRRKRGGVLVIHTGKIGDYVNASALFSPFDQVDVLIDRMNAPFPPRDQRIGQAWLVQDWSGSLWAKLRLALTLYLKNYADILVTTPNALNLFFGLSGAPGRKAAIRTYRSGQTAQLFMRFYDQLVEHTKDDLTVDSYLALAGSRRIGGSSPTKVVDQVDPERLRLKVGMVEGLKAGVGIIAGNPSKKMPGDEWAWMIAELISLGATVFVFGTEADEPAFHEVLEQGDFDRERVISLLGEVPLEDLPDNLAAMDLFVSADSGPAYLADSVGVPVLVYAGPCHLKEQRPLGEQCHFIEPRKPVGKKSFIFDTLHNDNDPDWYRTDSKRRVPVQAWLRMRLSVKEP
ncbi:MAG: hypothetical protein HQL52_13710 [Magnetococcales bacterium]|nr:hypothetical protein [Magnetococcales bacterium]